jgi:dihydrofolate reductase
VLTDIPGEVFEGCTVVYSLEEALDKCSPSEENFVIGGASIYQQLLPHTDRLYLTWVHKEFEGDVFFPVINFKEWEILSKEDIPFDDQLGFAYSFMVYDRKKI